MVDPERFKWQSITSDNWRITHCKMLWSGYRKKRLQPDPCENHDTYQKDITRSHRILTLLTLTSWEQSIIAQFWVIW